MQFKFPFMASKFYDPSSPNEQADPLPSAPLHTLAPNIVLQAPLTRRGSGPGIIIFLPHTSQLHLQTGAKPLDPEPVQKWAEEGFAVIGIGASKPDTGDLQSILKLAIDSLLALQELENRDKFSVLVYDDNPQLFHSLACLDSFPIKCLLGYGIHFPTPLLDFKIPTLLHLTNEREASANTTIHVYPVESGQFVLPQTSGYDAGSAALAHTRSLVFLRKILGGPYFSIEAIWDEHCYFEFEVRSVAKTMATMVQEPYVNHVPTMTGGVGRDALTAFYRDHFIFSNPDDATLQVVSRTIGHDRIVDEFIYRITHNRTVDWLLPGVPPTNKKLAIPMIAIVNVRGDRLYNEHIWWDQGTALRQVGVLPTHLPFAFTDSTSASLRLPVAGVECAQMLVNESYGTSNEMLGDGWGIQMQ